MCTNATYLDVVASSFLWQDLNWESFHRLDVRDVAASFHFILAVIRIERQRGGVQCGCSTAILIKFTTYDFDFDYNYNYDHDHDGALGGLRPKFNYRFYQHQTPPQLLVPSFFPQIPFTYSHSFIQNFLSQDRHLNYELVCILSNYKKTKDKKNLEPVSVLAQLARFCRLSEGYSHFLILSQEKEPRIGPSQLHFSKILKIQVS